MYIVQQIVHCTANVHCTASVHCTANVHGTASCTWDNKLYIVQQSFQKFSNSKVQSYFILTNKEKNAHSSCFREVQEGLVNRQENIARQKTQTLRCPSSVSFAVQRK